jgi:hypothetical protein
MAAITVQGMSNMSLFRHPGRLKYHEPFICTTIHIAIHNRTSDIPFVTKKKENLQEGALMKGNFKADKYLNI